MTLKCMIMIMAAMAILALNPAAGSAQVPIPPGAEVYEVFCYKGAPEAGNQVFSFETQRPWQATELCNEQYDKCQNKCIGCYLQSGDEICTDLSGKRFVKQPQKEGRIIPALDSLPVSGSNR